MAGSAATTGWSGRSRRAAAFLRDIGERKRLLEDVVVQQDVRRDDEVEPILRR